MKIKIRLYRAHDMDLITMKRSESYKLGAEIKKCLLGYARGEAYIPPPFDFDEHEDGYVGRIAQMHIVLSEKKPEEKAAIDLLDGIRPGYRCSFLKNLFRSSCPYLPLMAFADGNGYQTSKEAAWVNAMKGNKQQTQPEEPTKTEDKKPGKLKKPVTKPEKQTIRKEESVPKETVKPEPVIETAPQDDFDSLFAGFNKMGH